MSSVTQNISQTQLLDAVKQLPSKELEDFVNKVLVFRAKTRSGNLSGVETKLLKDIYKKFSAKKLTRIKQLREKLETVDLSEPEFAELAALNDSYEEFHAKRMENLVKFSNLKGWSLEDTLENLGIGFPNYD